METAVPWMDEVAGLGGLKDSEYVERVFERSPANDAPLSLRSAVPPCTPG